MALGQSILVIVSAALIGWKAFGRLTDPRPLDAEAAGFLGMAVAMAVTLALVLWQGRVARRTGSRIVAADRMHYLSDLLPNLGAMIALLAPARFGMLWLDPVIAILACVVLLLGARRIGHAAWDALMDRRADPEQIAMVERIVADYPGVSGSTTCVPAPPARGSSSRSMSRSRRPEPERSPRDQRRRAAGDPRRPARGRCHHPSGPGLEAAVRPRCSSSASTPGRRPRNAV